MHDPIVEAEGLVKTFAEVRALDGLTLTVQPGSIYGLLGPNGAGKTTLLRILTTLLPPDAGTARVAGVDVRADPAGVRAQIGLAGQSAAVDDYLTGRENVEMIGRLYGLPRGEARHRAGEVLARIHLAAEADRQVKTYSGGMRRRLDLAASLAGRPLVLFLDEPTAGLDPASRHDLWALIRDLVDTGTTVLLTTQYMEEADQLADRPRRHDPHHGAAAAGRPGHRLPTANQHLRRARRRGDRAWVRLRLVVGHGHAGPGRAHSRGGPGRQLHGRVPAGVHQLGVRAHPDHAGMAAGVRRPPARHRDHQRLARADPGPGRPAARPDRHRPGCRGAGVDGRDHRGLRPAGRPPVPPHRQLTPMLPAARKDTHAHRSAQTPRLRP